MTLVKLNEPENEILSFAGNVLEYFNFEGSTRFHISQITKVELKTDRHGKHSLKIRCGADGGLDGITVNENAVPKVNQLIAEVERAKGEFNFD
jgi:hypothetical protein